MREDTQIENGAQTIETQPAVSEWQTPVLQSLDISISTEAPAGSGSQPI